MSDSIEKVRSPKDTIEHGRQAASRLLDEAQSDGLTGRFAGTDNQKVDGSVGSANGTELAKARLFSANSNVQQKLKAVESLVKVGITKLTIKDKNGVPHELRFEVERLGDATLVHMFAKDSHGHERVLLRGVSRGASGYEQERDGFGNVVSLSTADAKLLGSITFTNHDLKSEGAIGNLSVHPKSIEDLRSMAVTAPYSQAVSLLDQASKHFGNQVGVMHKLLNGAVYFKAPRLCIDADGEGGSKFSKTSQEKTTLQNEDGSYLNATDVPYFVLPMGKYQTLGIRPGDLALVRDTRTGKKVVAVFGDVGPANKLGEGSIALSRALGLSASPTCGGTDNSEVEFLVLPGSSRGKPSSVQANLSRLTKEIMG